MACVCVLLGSCLAAAPMHARADPASPPSGGRSELIAPPALPQITQAVDPSRLSSLQDNVPPAATPANDRGRVTDDFPLPHMLLLLHRPQEQEQALEQFMQEQTAPESPNYHRWMTAGDFAQFGLAKSDLSTITAWLESEGFTINTVFSNGIVIDFSGTAGQVRQAFHTEVHNLEVGGIAHYANMSVPQIPSALAPAVVGIVSINDFRPHTNLMPRTEYTFAGGGGTEYALVPADLATIYNLNPLFNATPTPIKGAGQTIALIENTNVFSTSDITTFRTKFGLPSVTFTQVHPGGCGNPSNFAPNEGEAELDVEWAGAAAPSAALELVSCPDGSSFGGLIAMQHLLNAGSPPAIWSLSYGFCEAANGATANAAYVSTYQQAAAAGVSVFVSSGDEGAASCDANQSQATHGIGVSGFASTPYNVAVGGTDYGDTYNGTNATYWNASNTSVFGSAKSYINEIPWNDSCASVLIANFEGFGTTYGTSGSCNSATVGNSLTTAAGSGGPSGCATGTPSTTGVVSGSCAGTAKPSWQSGFLGNPADGVRDLPDVSLFAANGVWGHYFVYCYSHSAGGGTACTGAPSGWSGAGGTSFSAPILAGIQALVNQKAGSSQGNPNPTYYALAASEYGASGSSVCNSSLGNGVASNCIFYDVTQGDIDVNCTGSHNCYRPSGTNGVLSTSNGSYQPAYGTATGWDFATGIGTVNAANLVNNWSGSVAGATKLAFTQQPAATYASEATITVKVSVEDASGNVVTGDTSAVTLTLSGGSGGATLGGTLTRNAVAGVATFNDLTVDKTASAYKLNASDGSLAGAQSLAFNITTGAAQTVTFTTQPIANGNVLEGSTIPLAAHVTDAGGNPVPGQNILLAIGNNPGGSTLSVQTNPVSTNSSGNATFANVALDKVGTGYTLTATDSTTPAATPGTSNAFNVVAGAAKTVTFTTQPTSSSNIAAGATIPLVAHVVDSGGNPVSGNSISLAIANNPGGSALSVSANPVNSDTNGDATFTNVSLNKAGGGYTLTASDNTTPVATPASSNAFNIVAGAPATIAFTQQPTGTTVNTVMTPVLVVNIQDANGNPVSGDNVTLTIGTNPGGATLAGGNAVATDAGGNAGFGAVSLDKVGSGYTLVAGDGSGPPLITTSNAFDIAAGTTALAFTTQPTDVTVGSTLATIAVTEEDANGQPVTGDSSSVVDFTIAACGGTVDLGNATMVNGVATLNPGQHFYTVTSAPGLQIGATTGTYTGTSQYFAVTADPDFVFADGFEACRL